MLLNTSGLLRRLAVVLVVAKEDVLKAGFVAGQRYDGVLRRGLDHRVGGALNGQADRRPVVQGLHLYDAVQLRERVRGDGVRDGDGDLIALDVRDLVHTTDAHDASIPNDRDACAGLLDLA